MGRASQSGYYTYTVHTELKNYDSVECSAAITLKLDAVTLV